MVDILQTRSAQGELFIWTNVEAVYEEDFNRWYDREHMEERAQIPGFIWSRRYRASSDSACRYLALYRTRDVNVFLSAPYRKAFENQTQWSMTNFGRMFGNTRRVTIVTPVIGKGTGSAVALIQLGDLTVAQRAAQETGALVGEETGFLSARILFPDPELSTPLPTKGANNFIEPFLILETTTEAVAAAVAQRVAQKLAIAADKVTTFNLLWDLRSEDL
ncbi:hypothetical protein FACS1894158_15560 [Betaproteobacteria bacterium]|nr:hypothetical protein FACS1894158_15560 [Betaproteobacteria bacterium]